MLRILSSLVVVVVALGCSPLSFPPGDAGSNDAFRPPPRDAFRAPNDANFGDTNAADTGACTTQPTFADVLPIFTTSCASAPCHSIRSSDPGGGLVFDTPTARAEIVGNTSANFPALYLVIPGNPEASFLWRKITNQLATDGHEGVPMPLGDVAHWMELPQDQRELIRCWIASGAL